MVGSCSRVLLDIILSTVPFLLACMVRNTEERKAALRFSVSGGSPCLLVEMELRA
jgi:hypothetical protein